jgi:hypothetical protein
VKRAYLKKLQFHCNQNKVELRQFIHFTNSISSHEHTSAGDAADYGGYTRPEVSRKVDAIHKQLNHKAGGRLYVRHKNLYQNDDTWKNTPLGNSSQTIGSWGCLLTSVTMMLNGIGYNETPVTVNDKMKKAGGFQGPLFIPSVLPYVWGNCAYRDMQPCETVPAPLAQIDAAVAAGKPVILQVDWNKQAGIQTHFVLVKQKKGDDYVLYDPYKYGGDGPDKEVLLTQRYKFNGAKLATEISAVSVV